MAIYVDSPTWPGHGLLWSHLISDESLAELHGFAAHIGLPRKAFERDHYDVVAARFPSCLEGGATLVSSREIVAILNTSGLRRRKISKLAAQLGARPTKGEQDEL